MFITVNFRVGLFQGRWIWHWTDLKFQCTLQTTQSADQNASPVCGFVTGTTTVYTELSPNPIATNEFRKKMAGCLPGFVA